MKSESVKYAVGGIGCCGELIYDDTVKAKRPLLLMAPNWRGCTKANCETGHMLADKGYVVFVTDMFGEGKLPTGKENPMEFLKPYLADARGIRRSIAAGLDTLTKEADSRGIGDIKKRAAIGYCFGGGNVLDLARHGTDLAAVVSIHGVIGTSMPAKKGDIKSALLVLHGAADPVSPKADRDAFEAEMTAAGARWYLLTFGNVVHSYTDPNANALPVAKYDEPATRHGYNLAHAFIEDAFAGRI